MNARLDIGEISVNARLDTGERKGKMWATAASVYTNTDQAAFCSLVISVIRLRTKIYKSVKENENNGALE